jgi:hypothetical protein
MGPIPQGCYPSSRSTFLLSRLTSPGLIPGPTNSFPDTSATASASSPSFTGTLLRTNSMALSLSDSYARKFRTIRGFPSESKVVTRMFHPAGILGTMRPYCRRSMACLIQTDPPKSLERSSMNSPMPGERRVGTRSSYRRRGSNRPEFRVPGSVV